MRRIMLCLCLMAVLGACSSDDKGDEKIPIEIKKSDFSYLLGVATSVAQYYVKNDFAIYVTHYQFTVNNVLRSSDAYCPLKHDSNEKHPYMLIRVKDNDPSSGLNFRCYSCKAKYDYYSGKALNNIAKGTRINTYKTSYNEETETYTVWK